MIGWLEQIHQMVWGPWTLIMILGTGLYFTVRSGFFQILGFPVWWKKTVGSWRQKNEKEQTGAYHVTPVRSACTALAATIGTGNIAGVATALTAGGAGAVFWLWISAGIGMMTAYAETWLGIRYRFRSETGSWLCGPMVYMERGLNCPFLGKLYAAFLVLVSLGMGSMVQANSLSETIQSGTGFTNIKILVGIVLVMLTGKILCGGIHRITRVTEWLVPLSAGSYLFFSLAVLVLCRKQIPKVVGLIFAEAFRIEAAGGGILGFFVNRSVRFGLSRGVFSNEAGLGSLAVLHGSAEETTPEEQGMWAMFEVFFDTIVICTLTALVILCVTAGEPAPRAYDGAALTAWCFFQCFGKTGELFVAVSMIVFAFATIIAWYYAGEQAVCCLGGNRRIYLCLYLIAVGIGCIGRVEVIWLISDIWNGLLIFPNLLALWILGRKSLTNLKKMNILSHENKRE